MLGNALRHISKSREAKIEFGTHNSSKNNLKIFTHWHALHKKKKKKECIDTRPATVVSKNSGNSKIRYE